MPTKQNGGSFWTARIHERTALALIVASQLLILNIRAFGSYLQLTMPDPTTFASDFILKTSTAAPTNSSKFAMAYEQSLGFFDDIPNDVWEQHYRKRCLASPRYANPDEPNKDLHTGSRFDISAPWQYLNLDPVFTCPRQRKVGGLGDGGKVSAQSRSCPVRTAKEYDTHTIIAVDVRSRPTQTSLPGSTARKGT